MVAQQVPQPNYVSIGGAATYLGVSEATIRRLIASGEIPAHRVGQRLIRIRIADLEALTSPIRTA